MITVAASHGIEPATAERLGSEDRVVLAGPRRPTLDDVAQRRRGAGHAIGFPPRRNA